MDNSGKKMDPNHIVIEEDENINKSNLYASIRDAMEEIGIIIDDASEEKGYIEGFLKGNKKKPFKCTFKEINKIKGFSIKIEHKLSLKHIHRRDIRELSIEKYEEAIIVKFWDEIFQELGLGYAPGFGDKSRIQVDMSNIEKIEDFFRKYLTNLFNEYKKLKILIKSFEIDQQKLKNKYLSELYTISKKSQWVQTNILIIELFLDEDKQESIILTINSLDMKTFKAIPIEINYFIRIPRDLPRELNMSYKCQWSSPKFDNISQKMIKILNFELPSFEKIVNNFYSIKNEHSYHFQCSESVEEKGKKSKIKHDLTLLNPINVIQVRNRNTQGEVSQKVSSNFILVVRILLKITNENNYEGFLSVSDTIDLIKNLHNVLSQFFIKNEEDQKKEQELSKEDNILREDKEEHIIKCSKCSWLLSAGAIICPRCNTSVTEVEDKSFFNVDQSGYDKTSALHGEKEKSFTKKLMSDFDKALANWGDAEDKYQTIVKNNFTDMLMDENLKNVIANVYEDDDEITAKIKLVTNANEISSRWKTETFSKYLIELKNLSIKWLYITLDRLKIEDDSVFVVQVSYIVISLYNSHRFSFVKNVEKGKRGKEEINLTWEIDQGKDPKVMIALSAPSKKMNINLQTIYNKRNYSQFIEPIVDPDTKKVKKGKLTFDLYPLIRVEPFLEDKSNPRSIVIMRQFLENELAGFGDFIPLTMVIKILDSINDTMSNYSEKYLKQGQSLSEKWNKESEQGLTELDQYIEQSKYSHKKELDNKEISEIPVNQINSQPINHIQENNQIREPKSIAKTDTKPIQKPPLDNDYIEKNWIQSEFYRSQTSFVKELPSKFVIDPVISDIKIRETLYQLNSDISGLIQLAEKEIELFKSEEKTFEYVQNQIKVFLQQIKIKQLEIRAYEYELYRVKLGRVLS